VIFNAEQPGLKRNAVMRHRVAEEAKRGELPQVDAVAIPARGSSTA